MVRRLYILTFFVLLISSSIKSTAQNPFVQNPFLKEQGFFVSEFEKQTFQEHLSGKNIDQLKLFLAINPMANENRVKAIESKIDYISALLLQKKHKHTTDLSFLYRVFNGVQTRQLIKYEKFTTFQTLIEKGTYDCLTATAFYALILEKLNYSIEIRETAYHSYLTVSLNGRKILFESTDREEGFISDNYLVKARETKYSKQAKPGDENFSGLSGRVSDQSGMAIYSEAINTTQLAGLHYYNQAVLDYNQKQFKVAVTKLEKAYMLYPSRRIFNLLITSIHGVLRSPNITDKEIRLYSAKTRYYTMKFND